MSRTISSDYGSNRLALWYHGMQDRLQGEHARANARWGYLRPPAGRGKLIWIRAGATRTSVRVAVELLRAIRERRLDVRLVLTFERDYPGLLEERVAGLRKIGLGYGPCDAPSAVRRAFQRLDPFALICVDHAPAPNSLREAQRRQIHTVAYLTEPAATRIEAAFPLDAEQAERWRAAGTAAHLAPPVDPVAQLVEAQIEPSFRALVRGGAQPTLGWAHLSGADQLQDLARQWRNWSARPDSILFVSLDESAMFPTVHGAGMQRISAWQREPIAPGTLVLVDEPRWSPALAVSADAIYLAGTDRYECWQALAGGMPVCFASAATRPAGASAELPVDVSPGQFLSCWSEFLDAPMRARGLGDAGRRRFWDERRRSAEVVEDLLQRVYDW